MKPFNAFVSQFVYAHLYALCLTLAVIGAAGVAAPTIASAEVKIAIVDLQKAIGSSEAGKSAQKKYEEEVKKAQAEIDVEKKTLEKQQQAYQKQKESLNQQARVEKEEQLMKSEKDLNRQFEDIRDKLRRKNIMIVGELVKQIRGVIEEVAKEDRFNLVLERGNQFVLFADQQVDITERIVERFNEKNS